MKESIKNVIPKEQSKKSRHLFRLFKKKYAVRYNAEVWVLNPFALFDSPEKTSIGIQ
jgi:hypothetical protein